MNKQVKISSAPNNEAANTNDIDTATDIQLATFSVTMVDDLIGLKDNSKREGNASCLNAIPMPANDNNSTISAKDQSCPVPENQNSPYQNAASKMWWLP